MHYLVSRALLWPMVYDCFPFYNELDLLELRLHELADVVDRHVLVEATVTFQNRPKPLYFAENKGRFADFLHKIEHVVVDDTPEIDPWTSEFFQRDQGCRGLKDCRGDDIIIVADADEIVSAQALRHYRDGPSPRPKAVCQKVYYYWMNCLAADNCAAPVVLPFKDLTRHSGLTEVRIGRDRLDRLYRGGWHFAYLGGVDRIADKIRAFAHAEYNNPEFLDEERLRGVLDRRQNLFSDRQCVVVPVDASFPKYLADNQPRFRQYLAPTP